jgi:hypothetical protein
MTSSRRALVLAAIVLVLLPVVLYACPLCKDALEDKNAVPTSSGAASTTRSS